MSDSRSEGLSVRGLSLVMLASGLAWSVAVLGSGTHPFGAVTRDAWKLYPGQGQILLWRWVRPEGSGPGAWVWTVALIVCEALATGVLARMTAREAGPKAGVCAASALMLSGFFGPIGGAFALFSAPGWLCWLLTLEQAALVLDRPRRRALHAVMACLACGGALVCHAHASVLPIGLALGFLLIGPTGGVFDRAWFRFVVRPTLGLSLVVLLMARVVGGMPADSGVPYLDALIELVCVQSIQMLPWFWMLLSVLVVRGWFRRAVGLDQVDAPGERLRLAVGSVAWGALSLGAVVGSVPPSTGLIGLASMLPTVGRLWARALDGRRRSYFFRGRLAVYSGVAVAAVAFGFRQAPWYEHLTAAEPAGRRVERTLRVGGFRWTYSLYTPHSVEGAHRLPVSLVLHGSGSRGSTFVGHTNWVSEAQENHFLVVAPDALPLEPMRAPHWLLNPRVWNSGQHALHHPRRQVDDVAFFDAVLDDLKTCASIDPDRVFLAGHSCGGAMAFRLASERAEKFAAVAAVSGSCYVTHSQPSRPVPTLFMLGGKDVVLPPRGGLSALPWEIRRTPPVGQSLTRWSRVLGGWSVPCDFEVLNQGAVVVKYYGPHPSVHRMTVMLLENYGHAWPGSQGWQFERLLSPTLVAEETIDATDVAWRFFENQVRPDALSQSATRLIR